MSNLNKEYLTYIVRNLVELDSLADIIIVDTGAGISDTVLEFLVASGEIIVVTTTEPTSITDSYSLLKALSRHPGYNKEQNLVRVLANRVSSEQEGLNLFQKLNVVVERYLKIPISYLGSVPQDDKLMKAVMQQMPVSIQSPDAKSSKAYETVALRLMNKEEPKPSKWGMAAFFSHIVSARRTII